MLREMGVQVWQPRTAPVEPAASAASTDAVVPSARVEGDPAAAPARLADPAPVNARPERLATAREPLAAPVPAPAPAPASASAPAAFRPAASAAPVNGAAAVAPAAVLRGDWLAMFAAEGDDPQTPVWLVLADSPGADPREGDTGRLLQAMLKAAGLHKGARVWVAGVGRAGDAGTPLAEGLHQALAAHQPAMVLTLGRLSSQAALGSAEALGKLRGSVHAVGPVDPVPLVASYEPGWLLRSQDDKPRAWEDLCRALAAVRGAAPAAVTAAAAAP
ncbi:hypothetical protein GN316_08755 [Xylophilus sp. Kf1]|nr:hypothetical protein [Xylophilus sp. Kf1]